MTAKDRTHPHAHDEALRIAREEPLAGLSSHEAVAVVREVLDRSETPARNAPMEPKAVWQIESLSGVTEFPSKATGPATSRISCRSPTSRSFIRCGRGEGNAMPAAKEAKRPTRQCKAG